MRFPRQKWLDRVTAVAVFLASLLGPSQIAAQTTFQWPEARVDVVKYRSFEMCAAAVFRVIDSTQARSGVLADTLPFTKFGYLTPLPQNTVSVARQCLTLLSLDRLPAMQFSVVERVALIANQDSDMLRVLEQHIAAGRDNRARASAIDTAISLLLSAQPIRLRLADSLFTAVEQYGKDWSDGDQLRQYFDMARRSRYSGDTARMQKYADRYLALIPHVMDTLNEPVARGIHQRLADLLNVWKNDRELLDSLRRNTAGYASLRKVVWKANVHDFSLNLPIGEQSVPIFGDYWWPASSRGITYPRKGRITLVITIPTGFSSPRPRMLGDFAVVRRLAQKFPQLDVVIATPTSGFLMPLEPPSPEEEAALLYKHIMEFNKVPGVLAVANRPFWRFPDPDRRRVNDVFGPEDFRKTYSQILDGTSSFFYLIDADGVVVEVRPLLREGEEDLATMIEAISR